MRSHHGLQSLFLVISSRCRRQRSSTLPNLAVACNRHRAEDSRMISIHTAKHFFRSLFARVQLTTLVPVINRSEFEQAILRVTIGGLVLIYLTFHVFQDGTVTGDEGQVLEVAIGFFVFGIALALQVYQSTHISVARRFVGMVADNAVTTYCLIQTGEPGAVIIGVYLFITFGNGFRYGRSYLHVCQVMSLVGFTLVVAVSDFWRNEMSLSAGIILSMLALPFYVGVLAQRI